MRGWDAMQVKFELLIRHKNLIGVKFAKYDKLIYGMSNIDKGS